MSSGGKKCKDIAQGSFSKIFVVSLNMLGGGRGRTGYDCAIIVLLSTTGLHLHILLAQHNLI